MCLVAFIIHAFVVVTSQNSTMKKKISLMLLDIFFCSISMWFARDLPAEIDNHTEILTLWNQNFWCDNVNESWYAELTDDGYIRFAISTSNSNSDLYLISQSKCDIKYTTGLTPHVIYSENTYSYKSITKFFVDFGLISTRDRIEKQYTLILPQNAIITEEEANKIRDEYCISKNATNNATRSSTFKTVELVFCSNFISTCIYIL